MKLISWNVNGLRACVKKGFEDFFKEADADIFCIQETKLQEGQIDFAPEGYECYWNYAEKKGYSGTAVFTKQHPLKVWNGIGIEETGIGQLTCFYRLLGLFLQTEQLFVCGVTLINVRRQQHLMEIVNGGIFLMHFIE